jgi:adenosine deaminase
MSDTTMTKEFGIAVQEFGLGIKDLEKITINAMKSAFLHFDGRLRLIYEVIKPGFDAVK